MLYGTELPEGGAYEAAQPKRQRRQYLSNVREKTTAICPGWDTVALKLYYGDDANLSNLSEKTIAAIIYGNHVILCSIRKLYF
jgi:hypothetical protein